MKIKSVHIDGFGKWHDADFQFTDNPQVIFGSNEAGKTTLVHFITSVLFGFANGRGKNRYEQYKPKNGSAYGGSITMTVDNHDYQIHRGPGKKGGKVTVTDANGHTGGQKQLSKLLGPLDADLYNAIYSFSAQDLAAVDSVDRQELSSELKQMGAAGSQQWLATSEQLAKSADTIYRPRGRKWPLNQKLKQATALDEQIKSAQAQSGEYETLVAKHEQTADRLKQVQQQLKTARQKNDEMQHLHQLWPVYQSWRQANRQDAQSKITDDQVTKVQSLRVQEQTLRKTQDQQRSLVADRKAELGGLEDDDLEFYRQHEPDLQAARNNGMRLQAARDNAESAMNRQTQQQNELQQLKDKYQTDTLPLPLNDHDRTELEGLLESNRHLAETVAPMFSKPLLAIAGVGILVAIVGFAARLSILATLGLLVAVAIGVDLVMNYRKQRNQANHQAQRAQDALKRFGRDHDLSKYSPDSWLTMQSDLRRAVDLQQQIDASQQNIQMTNRRINQTMDEFKRFGNNSLNDWLANLNSFTDRMAKRDVQLKAVSQRFQTANSNLADTTDRLTNVLKQKATIYQQVGVDNDDEFDQAVAKRTAAATNQAAAKGYAAQINAEDRKRLAEYEDGDALQQAVDQAAQHVTDLTAQEQNLDNETRQEKVDLDAMVKDGTLSDLQQERADLATQIWDDTENWLAHELAIRWIDAALSKASAGRFPQIVDAAQDYFATLTGDRYQQIHVTDDGVSVLDQSGTTYVVEELSQGTAEQLYVALRLGFARVMSKNLSLPLIIDDGFVNFDNDRKTRMLKLLQQMAHSNQVLYLTADDRIKDSDLTVLDLNEMGAHDE